MKPLFKANQQEFDDYIPIIESSLHDWQLITISLTSSCILPYDEMIAKLIDMYNGYPGIVYHCGYNRIVALVKVGFIENFSLFKKSIKSRLPSDGCYLNVRRASSDALAALQQRYLLPDEDYKDDVDICKNRSGTKVLIADDDLMVLKVMEKVLSERASVVTVRSGEDVLDTYKQECPDISFIDIHMPGVHGFKNIENILNENPFANVIVLSADSVSTKILKALEYGAAGFVGKPIVKERVIDYMRACPTAER